MFKSVPRVLAALGPALVYIFAGIAVIHGNLSIGSVVTLAALLPKLSEPIRAYSGFYIDINVVEKIGEKFQQFLSAPREIQYDLPEREMAFDTVEFADVSLKNERGTVLDGISFRIEKGEKNSDRWRNRLWENHAVKDDRRIGEPKRRNSNGWRGKYCRNQLPTATGAYPGNPAGKLCV